jgi:hypothetical protein
MLIVRLLSEFANTARRISPGRLTEVQLFIGPMGWKNGRRPLNPTASLTLRRIRGTRLAPLKIIFPENVALFSRIAGRETASPVQKRKNGILIPSKHSVAALTKIRDGLFPRQK